MRPSQELSCVVWRVDQWSGCERGCYVETGLCARQPELGFRRLCVCRIAVALLISKISDTHAVIDPALALIQRCSENIRTTAASHPDRAPHANRIANLDTSPLVIWGTCPRMLQNLMPMSCALLKR